MPTDTKKLPPGLLEWVADIGGGKISRLERHVARREAWVVDVERDDQVVLEGFLRIDRNPREGANISLRREARICESLTRVGLPVPALLGWNEAHHAALFSRDPGRSDIDKLEDTRQQRAIMEDFIGVIARLHQLDTDQLGLDDILGPKPQSAGECALGDVEAQLSQFSEFLAHYTDPLITYSVKWLRRHAPREVSRVALVQGDTGPVNFMFQHNRVSAVVDWEWGHWGDPMEDLGNICVREFWNPSGGLSGLFELYEQLSGIPYTRFSAQYYRIQQNVRGMIAIHAACKYAPAGESLAWYLCYRYLGDRSTCEALADAMDIELERPEMPDEVPPGRISVAAKRILADDLMPSLTTAFTRSRCGDAAILVECMEREHRYGDAIRDIECNEISALLGRPLKGYRQAIEALDLAIEEDAVADEAVIRYLAARAYRDEWLYKPVLQLYPDRKWSPLD